MALIDSPIIFASFLFAKIREMTKHVLALLILFPPPPATAGAWLVPKGNAYLDQRGSFYRSDAFFDATGNTLDQPTYRKLETSVYGEYGLRETVSLGASLALSEAEQALPDPLASYNVLLTDPELFAKFHLWETDGLTLAVQPLIKLPSLGYFDEGQAPQAGSRSTDGELSLLAGYGFEWRGGQHYVDARLGYRARNGKNLGDQVRADVTLGLRPYDRWLVTASLYHTEAMQDASGTFSERFSQDYDLTKLETMVHYQWDEKQRFYVGTFVHSSGRNTGAGLGFVGGVAYDFGLW